MRQQGSLQRAMIDQKLVHETWIEAASFASFYMQSGSLYLQPWEMPPCWIDVDNIAAALATPDDGRRLSQAAQLLRQMLANNISRFSPDPLRELNEAEQTNRARKVIDDAALVER
jgi:hypothetical protein